MINTDSSTTTANSDTQLKNFTKLLRNYSSTNFCNIYSSETNKTCKYHASDVLSDLTQTVNFMQKLDKMKLRKRTVIPGRYKNTFWTINGISHRTVKGDSKTGHPISGKIREFSVVLKRDKEIEALLNRQTQTPVVVAKGTDGNFHVKCPSEENDNTTSVAAFGPDQMVHWAEMPTQIILYEDVKKEFDMSFHHENKKLYNEMSLTENFQEENEVYDFVHEIIVERERGDTPTQILATSDNSISKQRTMDKSGSSKQNTEDISTETIKINSPIEIIIKRERGDTPTQILATSDNSISKQSTMDKSGSSKQNTEDISTETIKINSPIEIIINRERGDTPTQILATSDNSISKQSTMDKSGSSKQNTEDISTETIKINSPIFGDKRIVKPNTSKLDYLQGPSENCDIEVQGNTDNLHNGRMIDSKDNGQTLVATSFSFFSKSWSKCAHPPLLNNSQTFDYSQCKNASPHFTDLGTTLNYNLHEFEKFEELSSNKHYSADAVESQKRTKSYKKSLKNRKYKKSIQDHSVGSENINPTCIDYNYLNNKKCSDQNILDEEFLFNNVEGSAAKLTSSSSTVLSVRTMKSKFGGFQAKSIENSCLNDIKTMIEIGKQHKSESQTFDTSDKTLVNSEHSWQSIDSTEIEAVDNNVNNVFKQFDGEEKLKNDERNNNLSPILSKGSEVDIFGEMFDTEYFPTTEFVTHTSSKLKNLIPEEIELINFSDCQDFETHFEEHIDKNIDILDKPVCNIIKRNPCLEIRTTNNKHISEMALRGTRKVFNAIVPEDISYNDTIGENLNNNQPKILMPNNQVVKLKKPSVNLQKSDHTPDFTGFSKPSNKNIQSCNKTSGNTDNIFKDVDVISNFPGFTTASNKKVEISEKALKLGKNLLKEAEIEKDHLFNKDEVMKGASNKINVLSGFSTANNKKITISKEALKAIPHIFIKEMEINNTTVNDYQEIELEEILCSVEVSTTDNANISEKALENNKKSLRNQDKNALNDKNEVLKGSSSKSVVFSGFSTGNNKKVEISKRALEATVDIFKEIESSSTIVNDLQKIDQPLNVDLRSESNKNINISPRKHKRKYTDSDISNSSIVQKVYENHICDGSESSGIASIRKIMSKASSSTNIGISNALEIKKNSIPSDLINTQVAKNFVELPKLEAFPGFCTGNNEKVKISKRALEATVDIFKEIESNSTIVNDLQEIDQPLNVDLRSESNKNINISPRKRKRKYTDSDISNSSIVQKVYENHICDGSESSGIASIRKIMSKASSSTNISISNALEIKKNSIPSDLINTQVAKNFVEIPKLEAFPGFCTGNNEKVKISKRALEATVDIFKEIESSSTIVNDLQEIDQPLNVDLRSESNKNINISPRKRKRKYTDSDDSNSSIVQKVFENHFHEGNDSSCIHSIGKVMSKESLSTNKSISKALEMEKNTLPLDIINTQLAENFNESVHTVDFCMEKSIEKECPTSPILHSGKKRKIFKTPYNKHKKREITNKPTNIDIEIIKHKYKSEVDYKKHKVLSLKDLIKLEEDSNVTEKENLLVAFDELINFKFDKVRNRVTDAKVTMQDLKTIFLGLPDVNKKIVPKEWLDNHLVQISWKLVSYEIKFPNTMKNCFNTKTVLDQLKYRYDRELYNVQRPALRKILEKDAAPGQPIVLFVMKIYSDDNLESDKPQTMELQLSDGWYSVRTTIDKFLERMVTTGKITVGSKLMIQGAELINCEQGIAPWEDTSRVRLKIFGNSTRRARWDAKLGFRNGAILTRLSAVDAEGGKLAKMRVFIARVYPILYMEKLDDGSTVTRSERLEHLHQAKFETDRQTALDKLIDEVDKDFDGDSVDSEDLAQGSERRSLDTGSQIAGYMRKCRDPTEFRSCLTETQNNLLDRHTMVRREEKIKQFQARLQDKIRGSRLKTERKVTVVLKVRVADVTRSEDGLKLDTAMLSIWNASEGVMEIVREGCWLDVLNVVPGSQRMSELCLSANRRSEFRISRHKVSEEIASRMKSIMRITRPIKELPSVRGKYDMTIFGEIDTVGLVSAIEPGNEVFLKSSQLNYQYVLLCDAEKNFIRLRFYGGLGRYGYQNLIETGQIVICKNLKIVVNFDVDSDLKQYRVTEFTVITKMPNHTSKAAYSDLCKSLGKVFVKDYCKNDISKPSTAFVKKENLSPSVSTPLKKQGIDKRSFEYDLSGIDFASTFKSPDDLTPEQRSRKKRLHEKLLKLNMYDEPPRISPMHFISRSLKANGSYKSPLASSEGSGVNLQNRSVIKPVKLNFSANSDSNIDNFAEEFEPSQPLSLDLSMWYN